MSISSNCMPYRLDVEDDPDNEGSTNGSDTDVAPASSPMMVVTERSGNHLNRLLQQQYKTANAQRAAADAAAAAAEAAAAEAAAAEEESGAATAAMGSTAPAPDVFSARPVASDAGTALAEGVVQNQDMLDDDEFTTASNTVSTRETAKQNGRNAHRSPSSECLVQSECTAK